MTRALMIDTETLGTTPRSALLQVGAVVFDPAGGELGERMECTVDASTSIALGAEVDGKTVQDFWLKQPEAARVSVTTSLTPVRYALEVVAHLYRLQRCTEVWCLGANFDAPILEFHYERLGLKVPWRYSEVRCVRTVYALATSLGWERSREPTAHTSLADAVAQAVEVQAALAWIRCGDPSTVKVCGGV